MLTSVEVQKNGAAHPKLFTVFINGEKAHFVTAENSPTGYTGCTKYVFASKEYVLKMGRMGESRLVIEPEDRKFFAEVVYADVNKQWYVQKRVNCVPNALVTTQQLKDMMALGRKYGFRDIDVYGQGDNMTGHNFTVTLEGQPVIYDYDWGLPK